MPTQDESITSPVIRQVKLDGRTFTDYTDFTLDYSYRFAVSSKTKENKKKQEKTI